MHLRPFNPDTDRPRLAELRSAVELEPVTVDQIKEEQENAPPDFIHLSLVAEDDNGRMIGCSQVSHSPGWMKPGQFWANTVVDKDLWGRGVGSALYKGVEDFALSRGANTINAFIRDDLPQSLEFTRHRGFQMDRHIFGSSLDVGSLDATRFSGTAEKARDAGIRFASLTDFSLDDDTRHRLYDLETTVRRDIPGRADWPAPPYEQYNHITFAVSTFRPECYLLAIDGDRWVGLCASAYCETGDARYLYHKITGVLREYRGRGIATALKLLAVETARDLGASFIRTENDSENAPMLAINRKMGFVPEPGAYLLQKKL
jgi:GNAT superfamily N-acetyltransferase